MSRTGVWNCFRPVLQPRLARICIVDAAPEPVSRFSIVQHRERVNHGSG